MITRPLLTLSQIKLNTKTNCKFTKDYKSANFKLVDLKMCRTLFDKM